MAFRGCEICTAPWWVGWLQAGFLVNLNTADLIKRGKTFAFKLARWFCSPRRLGYGAVSPRSSVCAQRSWCEPPGRLQGRAARSGVGGLSSSLHCVWPEAICRRCCILILYPHLAKNALFLWKHLLCVVLPAFARFCMLKECQFCN